MLTEQNNGMSQLQAYCNVNGIEIVPIRRYGSAGLTIKNSAGKYSYETTRGDINWGKVLDDAKNLTVLAQTHD